MLTVQGVHLWRGDRHVLRGVSFEGQPGTMRAAHRQERRRQDHAACAPSPGCSIPRKGRCSGAARRRASPRDEFHSELAYLGHEPPLKGDLVGARESAAIRSAFAAPSPPLKSMPRSRAPAPHAFADRAVRMLSAGQKRRVALAGVLLTNAVLWLLDEPTTNLDADGQQLVRDLIERATGPRRHRGGRRPSFADVAGGAARSPGAGPIMKTSARRW